MLKAKKLPRIHMTRLPAPRPSGQTAVRFPVKNGDRGQSSSDSDPVINSSTRSERHSASTNSRLNSLHSRRNHPTKSQRSLRSRASSLHSRGRDRCSRDRDRCSRDRDRRSLHSRGRDRRSRDRDRRSVS